MQLLGQLSQLSSALTQYWRYFTEGGNFHSMCQHNKYHSLLNIKHHTFLLPTNLQTKLEEEGCWWKTQRERKILKSILCFDGFVSIINDGTEYWVSLRQKWNWWRCSQLWKWIMDEDHSWLELVSSFLLFTYQTGLFVLNCLLQPPDTKQKTDAFLTLIFSIHTFTYFFLK